MKIKITLVIISLVLLSGCGSLTWKTKEPLKSAEKIEEKKIKKEITTSSDEEIAAFNKEEDIEYKISAGDVIELVSTYKTVENKDYTVDISGELNIEKIGVVRAEKKSLKELEKDVNEKFAEYYKSEKIILNFKKINNNISVLGAVKSPGIMAIEGKVTLVEAVAKTGGIISEGEISDYFVRVTGSNGKSVVINLEDILYKGDFSKNIILKKGDTVYIFGKSGSVEKNIYVFGDVARTGEVEYKGNISLLEAIIKAGGPTKYGKMDKVFVIRTDSEDKVRVYGCELEKILNTKDSKMVYLENKDIVSIGKSMIGKVNGAIESVLPPLMLTNSVLSPIESINNLMTTE